MTVSIKRILTAAIPAAFLFCAAHAAAPGGLNFGKHDTKTPIDITADSLEVLQDQNKAIFAGKVLAIQGDMRLKADRMTVHYRKGAGTGGMENRDAISMIEVDGNVFLATPKETASGAKGLYNVDDRMLTLENDVRLTQDQNVLKGVKLEYNLASGRAVMVGSAAGGKGPRVRGLFVPKENDDR